MPGTIVVNVSEVGGAFEKISIREGSTIKVALLAAGANLDTAKTILRNGVAVQMDEICNNDDTIYVVPQVKGNK